MQEPSSTPVAAPGAYLALRIASWVALTAILVAVVWAFTRVVANWDVISV